MMKQQSSLAQTLTGYKKADGELVTTRQSIGESTIAANVCHVMSPMNKATVRPTCTVIGR